MGDGLSVPFIVSWSSGEVSEAAVPVFLCLPSKFCLVLVNKRQPHFGESIPSINTAGDLVGQHRGTIQTKIQL